MTRFERPRYVAGKALTAADLELEQSYHIEKRRLLNRTLHGAGVVSGLDVAAGERRSVTVAPGLAIDARGREILICEPRRLAIPSGGKPVSIYLLYSEEETDHDTIRETYELRASAGPVPEEAVVLAVIDA